MFDRFLLKMLLLIMSPTITGAQSKKSYPHIYKNYIWREISLIFSLSYLIKTVNSTSNFWFYHGYDIYVIRVISEDLKINK